MGSCDSCNKEKEKEKEKPPINSTLKATNMRFNPPLKKSLIRNNYHPPKPLVQNNNIYPPSYGLSGNTTRADSKIYQNTISPSEFLKIQKTYHNLFTIIGNQKQIIGEGGQAIIKKCYSPKFKKTVVEKVIKLNISTNNSSKYNEIISKINLIKEAMLLFKCDYPNVVKIYDFIENPITIVMEYCDRGSLRSVLDKGIHLPLLYKIFLICSICDGLGYIHYKEIIHGDLKGANILLSTEKKYIIGHQYYPIPKLADFGLSQIRPNKIIAGTPGYIAPEIFKGSGLTKKTDIFALGMVMFEILSGLKPLPSDFTLAMQYLEENKPPCTKEVLRIAWEKRIEAFLPGINNAYYDAFYTIMICCINDDPDKRPDILSLFIVVKELYNVLLKVSKEKVYDESEFLKRCRLLSKKLNK